MIPQMGVIPMASDVLVDSSGVDAFPTVPRQRVMSSLEIEPELVGNSGRHRIHERTREIQDPTAALAASMQMRQFLSRPSQVVGGSAVPEMNMLDDANFSEGLKGAIYRCAVHRRITFGDRCRKIIGGRMPMPVRESFDYGHSSSRNSLATSAESLNGYFYRRGPVGLCNLGRILNHAWTVAQHSMVRTDAGVAKTRADRGDSPRQACYCDSVANSVSYIHART